MRGDRLDLPEDIESAVRVDEFYWESLIYKAVNLYFLVRFGAGENTLIEKYGISMYRRLINGEYTWCKQYLEEFGPLKGATWHGDGRITFDDPKSNLVLEGQAFRILGALVEFGALS